MLKFRHLIAMIIPFYFGFAQNSTEIDSTRIVSYADKFVVKLNVDNLTDSYSLRNLMDGSNLQINPNIGYNFFISLDYQFLGLSFGSSPSLFNIDKENDLKGESTYSEFRFRAALGRWIQGFQVSSVEGFYVENTGDFIPGWIEGKDPYIQLTDCKSQRWGMSTSYVFNQNFSFRNILYNTEWQKQSAGSFIPTLFYSYDRLSYTLNDIRSEEDIYPVRLALAYFYTFVVKEHWFLNVNLAPSLGVRFSNATDFVDEVRSDKNSSALTRTLEGGMELGYASEKIVFGLKLSFDVNGYDKDKFRAVENNVAYANLYFGYRFNTPGFIDRTYNKFAEKVGLD